MRKGAIAYSTDSRIQQKIDNRRRKTSHNTDDINLSKQIFDSMRFNGRYFTSEMQKEEGAFTRNHHTDYEETTQTYAQTREEVESQNLERKHRREKALQMRAKYLEQSK